MPKPIELFQHITQNIVKKVTFVVDISKCDSFVFNRTRGLGQFVRSQNIRTVGNLCSLSEYEIHNLPIRSPKVQVVRRALDNFEKQQEKLRSKVNCASNRNSENTMTGNRFK